MSRGVKIADLKDQTGKLGPHPILYCRRCGAEYSANAGDYWDRPPAYVFRCCRRNMRLGIKSAVYEDVSI